MATAPDQHLNVRIAASPRACPPPASTACMAQALGARAPRHAAAAPCARPCEFKRHPYRVESALRRLVGVGTLRAHNCPIEARRSTGPEPARLSVTASSRFPVTRRTVVAPDARPRRRASRVRPGVSHQPPDGACGRMKLKYGGVPRGVPAWPKAMAMASIGRNAGLCRHQQRLRRLPRNTTATRTGVPC